MTTPFLSIIIPAYNEEHRLPRTLEQIFAFLGEQNYTAEVLVVENGSKDETFEIASEFARHNPILHVYQEIKRGKGNAVRRGMLEAGGHYRFLCDADLSMPIAEVNKFLPPALNDIDIAIASREVPGAVRYNEPQYRHLTGRVFNTLIQILVLPDLQDTQCGFKCFRAEVAEDIFRYQTLNGWSFDVEVLYIAQRKGYRICEVPINWYFKTDTKISVLQDSWQMFLDLLTIRRNARRGLYDSKS
ncbi:MAG: dolichyl-phosphate beta-glucosyltransferase [Anaerolineales bacterium]